MNTDRWRRVEALFEEALELDITARETFLDNAIEDPEIRYEVRGLLEADEHPADYLDSGAAALAAEAWHESAKRSRLLELDGRCGNYELIEQIGSGGMSDVFLGKPVDERLAHRVAIKVLRPGGWERAEIERRFRAEGQVLSSLSHPNIARTYDAGVDERGYPYLVMEYVDGETLMEHCRTARLDLDHRLELFEAICAAVQHAHQRLVVHRDLKPANIVVGRNGQVKLLDFGIAKLLGPGDAALAVEAPQTRTGLLVMTPEYAAPEQLRGAEATTATDVYALGLLLYELLTDERPFRFETRSATEIERVVHREAPAKPSTVVARSEREEPLRKRLSEQLHGDLDTIVLEALRKKPENRYVSAQALADDVHRFREGLPIAARHPSAAYVASKFVRRHRLGVTLAAAALATLIGFATAMAWLQRETARQRDRARLESRKAQEVTDFLLGLFAASDPAEARGEELTAAELLARGTREAQAMAKQPEVQARMLSVMGRVYQELGDYARAEALLREALEAQRRAAGTRPLDLAEIQGHLAAVLIGQSEYAEAEALLRTLLAERRRELGGDHPLVATTLNNLAVVLGDQGRARDAEPLLRRAVGIQRQASESSPLELAESLINLGNVLHALGRYAEAEPPLREALEVLQARLGVHPRTADAINALANLVARTGHQEEAQTLLAEALAMRRELYGDEHPQVAKNLNDLAVVQRNQGRFLEAALLFREAMNAYERLVGSEHLAVAIVAGNLAEVLLLAGNADEAEQLYQKSLEIAQAALGPENPRVVRALTGLGAAQDAAGHVELAEENLVRAVALGRRLFEDGDLGLAASLLELGAYQVVHGQAAEAEPHLQQAYFAYREKLGVEHERTARAMMWLGLCRVRLGRRPWGERLLHDALDVQRELLPPTHPHRLATERALDAL